MIFSTNSTCFGSNNCSDIVSSDFFGQIFITDSNKVRISNILEEIDGESLSFEIDNGVVR